jgi:hypothetical protein
MNKIKQIGILAIILVLIAAFSLNTISEERVVVETGTAVTINNLDPINDALNNVNGLLKSQAFLSIQPSERKYSEITQDVNVLKEAQRILTRQSQVAEGTVIYYTQSELASLQTAQAIVDTEESWYEGAAYETQTVELSIETTADNDYWVDQVSNSDGTYDLGTILKGEGGYSYLEPELKVNGKELSKYDSTQEVLYQSLSQGLTQVSELDSPDARPGGIVCSI